MNKAIYALLISLGAYHAGYALDFVNNAEAVITVNAESSTGLEAIYVLSSTAGVKATYPDASARWSRFSRLGGAHAEELVSTVSGSVSSVDLVDGDYGYIVESGGRQHCFWITDYSKHRLVLTSLQGVAQQDCDRTALSFEGDASEIDYYSITGRRMTLSRDLKLSYNKLTFDEEAFAYHTEPASINLEAVSGLIGVPAILTDTHFVLEGDRFLQAWNRTLSIESPVISATAVECTTRATQTQREVENEQKEGVDGLGGSAPCTINFEAAITDAAIYRQWEISRSPEFEILENSFSETDFEYTFTEQGTTYVRMTVADASGDCTFEGPVYEVFIGESKLLIPNAFSPQGSPGVNDEWKVSYKSLVRFECSVFARNGTCVFSTTDPAQGWDGRYHGKFVPAGVYYYVINAMGADGVAYKRSGDINIVNFSEGTNSSQSSETESL